MRLCGARVYGNGSRPTYPFDDVRADAPGKVSELMDPGEERVSWRFAFRIEGVESEVFSKAASWL